VIGCDGNGIAREVEGEIALSLTLAHLPHVKVETFHVLAEDLPDLDSAPDAWINLIGVPPQDNPQFVLLADPFTAKVNDLLQGLDYAYPSAVKIGGLASDRSALGTGLFCDRKLYREGTVGVALSGEIVLETIVAQGCRPIGPVFRITEGERNILLNLEEPTTQAVDPPLTLLRNLIASLSTKDQELAQHSLFIGIARDEFKTTLEPGDFLIRNLIGVDPRVGAVAIGDRVRPGQRVQFHLRDAKASAEDLELLLKRYHQQAQISASSPVGALMFSCLGRGEGLYNQPNFDSQLFGSYVNNIPLSGFFCNGEIGPVGGSTFLHGYTSVFGICRQP
jgi:small ligand-binding sensory domain FIST